ncbi:MAG: hypothetical protein AABX79_02765 [Nanoarchaeota archaeon]
MKISDGKRDKISEQILAFLYPLSVKPAFTSHIAREVARDEEFVKGLLLELKRKELVAEIRKNSKGEQYARRSRWKLTGKAYDAYRSVLPGDQNQGQPEKSRYRQSIY